MKVLVTGGTGFTGSHLVRRLLGRGHDVMVIDIQKGLFFDELTKRGAKIELGSITDMNDVNKIVKGCEVVYHVASSFRDVTVPNEAYWSVDVEGTRNLLDASYRLGVKRFIHCSTIGVYGNVRHPPASEQTDIAPADYYQFAKYEGEKVVEEYVQKGLDAVIIRPAAIYGPGDSGRFLILFRMVKQGFFLMFGDGKAYYHTVFIDNLLDAFELAADKEGISGEKYIIADEHYFSLNELVQYIAESLGISARIWHLPFWPLWVAALICEMICKPLNIYPPIFRRRVDWFRQVRAFSIDKAKRELNYQPKIDLQTGLSMTTMWYGDHGYL